MKKNFATFCVRYVEHTPTKKNIHFLLSSMKKKNLKLIKKKYIYIEYNIFIIQNQIPIKLHHDQHNPDIAS